MPKMPDMSACGRLPPTARGLGRQEPGGPEGVAAAPKRAALRTAAVQRVAPAAERAGIDMADNDSRVVAAAPAFPPPRCWPAARLRGMHKTLRRSSGQVGIAGARSGTLAQSEPKRPRGWGGQCRPLLKNRAAHCALITEGKAVRIHPRCLRVEYRKRYIDLLNFRWKPAPRSQGLAEPDRSAISLPAS